MARRANGPRKLSGRLAPSGRVGVSGAVLRRTFWLFPQRGCLKKTLYANNLGGKIFCCAAQKFPVSALICVQRNVILCIAALVETFSLCRSPSWAFPP